ncbi:MAG: response regulator [Oscillospiraceae bacterium]|jgi:PAS domain S-box-containing protein|nr:response regulator [Oscillospiraceae bacterium]
MFFKNKHLSNDLLANTAIITAMYEALPDIVFSLDTSLRYTSCNHGFGAFSAKPMNEIIGKTDYEVFGEGKPMVEYFIEMNQKVLDSRNPVTINEWVIYPDGSKRYLETIKAPLFLEGELIGLMGVARDVTAHKKAEEAAKEASQTKSQFLANMSHEIRTPMNAIIGMTDLLVLEKLNDKQREYVDNISISSRALLDIINDILDFSKIEAGKLELVPTDYNLHEFISNISSMFQYMVQKKGLAFRFEDEGLLPGCLFGDDVRLRQVLINLCSNAVKFTQQGYVKLKVAVKGQTIMFSIQDTGIGIREEDIPRLFEVFAQADERKNRNIVGTGLGLSISKAFVEMMGGEINVESEYGRGTTFTVTVPMVLGNEENVLRLSKMSSSEEALSAPGAKILVVDDNELNLKVAVGLLNLYNVKAVTASSGKEAIRLVQKIDYDIVFMDHMMPELGGVETVRALRAMGGKYSELVIIAFTANAVRGVKEMFLANGFNGFISKPIDTAELAATLREWLPPEVLETGEVKKPTAQTAGASPAPRHVLNAIRALGEINVDAGLSYFSGIEDLYIETLSYFCETITEQCEAVERLVGARDLKGLAVAVHGMKSGLATIGAMGLSGAAFELEKAAKEDMMSFCEDNLPAFTEMVRSLHGRLLPLFPQG